MTSRHQLRAVPPPPPGDDRSRPLKKFKRGDTYSGMDQDDLHGRIARLEGASTALLGAVGIVSAVLIGGMALLWSDVSALEDKVDALPSLISNELRELTRETRESYQAGQNAVNRPSVIVIPQGALNASEEITPDEPLRKFLQQE